LIRHGDYLEIIVYQFLMLNKNILFFIFSFN